MAFPTGAKPPRHQRLSSARRGTNHDTNRAMSPATDTMVAIMTAEVMAVEVEDTPAAIAIKAATVTPCEKTEDAAADDSAAMTTPMQDQHYPPLHTSSAPRKLQ